MPRTIFILLLVVTLWSMPFLAKPIAKPNIISKLLHKLAMMDPKFGLKYGKSWTQDKRKIWQMAQDVFSQQHDRLSVLKSHPLAVHIMGQHQGSDFGTPQRATHTIIDGLDMSMMVLNHVVRSKISKIQKS